MLEIFIHHVMTHGKAGAVNDVRQSNDGKTYDFLSSNRFRYPCAISIASFATVSTAVCNSGGRRMTKGHPSKIR